MKDKSNNYSKMLNVGLVAIGAGFYMGMQFQSGLAASTTPQPVPVTVPVAQVVSPK